MTDTAPPAPAPPASAPGKRPLGLIPLGATATVVGIAVCVLLDPTLGGLLVCTGILSQAWGLHRLGRGAP